MPPLTVIPQEDVAPIQFNLHVNTTLNISAKDARRIVNRQIVTKLGTGLGAKNGYLMIRDQAMIWRVPIVLSLPQLGDLGEVGIIEVDAYSGNVLSNTAEKAKIIQHAKHLYAGATLPTE